MFFNAATVLLLASSLFKGVDARIKAEGTTALYSGTGCAIADQFTTSLEPGFKVRVFDYQFWWWPDYNSDKWVGNSYTTKSLYGTATGVTEPNFTYKLDLDKKVRTNVYGVKNVKYNHFLNEYTGYLYAEKSGLYTITIDNIDDGAMFWLGSENAFACCTPQNGIPGNSGSDYLMRADNQWGGPQDPMVAYVYLDGGNYYPMRIVYMNVGEDAIFDMRLSLPSGKVIENLKDVIFNIESIPNGVCTDQAAGHGFNIPVTKTYEWTKTHTTTKYSEISGVSAGVLTTWFEEQIFVPSTAK